jgi:hypothetical protein
MPSLKHIIAGKAGVSHLSTTALWDQDLATITPAQLVAFVAKFKYVGRADEAESALQIAMSAVELAANRGEIPRPPMLEYRRPDRIVMTRGELRRALAFMKPVQAYATVFALETGLSSQEVMRLKQSDLADLRRKRELSDVALACLERVPRNIVSPYVFWRPIKAKGRTITAPMPIMDLDEAIFDAFGFVWAELEQAYANLIQVDEDSDREDFDSIFGR